MNIAIVIPTYNEALNIQKLTEEIFKIPLKVDLFFVDDNSPDGTGQQVEGMQQRYPNRRISLVKRDKKAGRGSACMEGFKIALKDKYDYIFEMDADLSHEPGEIPLFIKEIASCDLVIGSRYLKDSRIINWSLQRRIFSKIANCYARMLLKIPITDYTNGYRCYRSSALNTIDFDSIDSQGYIVLSEIAYSLFKKGCLFKEVPTIFVNRRRGISNLTLNEIWNAFTSITKLRYKFNNEKSLTGK
jgi:dolichol-phosphate mannosyltransferase